MHGSVLLFAALLFPAAAADSGKAAAPAWDYSLYPKTFEAVAGETLTFAVKAEAGEGGKLVYTHNLFPPGASFDPAAQTFRWTPQPNQVGRYLWLVIQAEDAQANLSRLLFNITVSPRPTKAAGLPAPKAPGGKARPLIVVQEPGPPLPEPPPPPPEVREEPPPLEQPPPEPEPPEEQPEEPAPPEEKPAEPPPKPAGENQPGKAPTPSGSPSSSPSGSPSGSPGASGSPRAGPTSPDAAKTPSSSSSSSSGSDWFNYWATPVNTPPAPTPTPPAVGAPTPSPTAPGASPSPTAPKSYTPVPVKTAPPTRTPTPVKTPSPLPSASPTAAPSPSPSPSPRPSASPPFLGPAWSTYLGGTADDAAQAISVDPSGGLYIAGYTESADFPTAAAYQGVRKGPSNLFLSKFSSSGSGLIFSTFLGGADLDYCNSIAIDAARAVYLTGATFSADFPTVNPYQASRAGETAAFLVKFASSGSALLYSTYLGGGGVSRGTRVAIDSSLRATVAGESTSIDFPTLSPYQSSLSGPSDLFAARFSSTGSALECSTYLGGSSEETALAVALPGDGTSLLAGYTSSVDFPTRSPYQASQSGCTDAFILRLSSSGSSLILSTYLGGAGDDIARSLVQSSGGDAIISGETSSSDFPTRSAYQSTLSGPTNLFLARVSSAGSTLVFSTFLGGSGDVLQSCMVDLDAQERCFVGGDTSSMDFPTVNPYQSSLRGTDRDAFLTVFASGGSNLDYSTYLGGSEMDGTFALAIHPFGGAIIAGLTYSDDFPTVNTFQAARAGGGDAFVSLFQSQAAGVSRAPPLTPSPSPTPTVSPMPPSPPAPGEEGPVPSPAGSSSPASSPEPLLTPSPPPTPSYPVLQSGDYDGDGTSEIAVFRPASGLWLIRGTTKVAFGGEGDIPASGDYDGNGTAEIAFFRPASGLWDVRGLTRLFLGGEGSVPVPADYAGDGKAQAAVFDPEEGAWSGLLTPDGETEVEFGTAGDIPVPGDYDGEKGAETAVFRPGDGLWIVRGITQFLFGTAGDIPVPRDYDLDGETDPGLFRPATGEWEVLMSGGEPRRLILGGEEDLPVPADYDGDGALDPAVFSPSSGLWSIWSRTRTVFGREGDIPLGR